MTTTPRFESAVSKLYKAFHNNELDAMDCCHCAVGNLCDNDDRWVNNYVLFGDPNRVNPIFVSHTGYSIKELATIELVFIHGVTDSNEKHKFDNSISSHEVSSGSYTKERQKELQFQGLCAVIEYLCELDNIPNIMDFTSLFETEADKPKRQLVEVFS